MNPLRSLLGRALLLAVLSGVLPACSTWECTSETCADGCCDSEGVCQVGNVDRACGLLGRSCQNCQTSQTCGPTGQCVSKCNAQNCPNGCCEEDGSCRLSTNQFSFACGRGGATCVDCNAGGPYTKDCAQGACCSRRYSACSTSSDCCPGTSCRTDFDSTLKCL
jgi:hypothetical protein